MQYGPQIVKNGLVLALDAAEANSYGPIKAEVLVVAGGGGGGSDMGGGGGGEEYRLAQVGVEALGKGCEGVG